MNRICTYALTLYLLGFSQFPAAEPFAAGSPDNQRYHFSSGNHPVALLELYSSQGCSSCPPAERWISTLTSHPDLWKNLVPVVFHVDYWDHLGWKDPYSSAQFSQRQRKYRALGFSKAVYTPGFIYSGREWRGWFNGGPLPVLSNDNADKLEALLDGSRITACYSGKKPQEKLILNIAILGFNIVTDIKRGENRGHKLPQNFVVLNLYAKTSENGHWQMDLPSSTINTGEKRAIAFWISRPGNPQPLQATGGWIEQLTPGDK